MPAHVIAQHAPPRMFHRAHFVLYQCTSAQYRMCNRGPPTIRNKFFSRPPYRVRAPVTSRALYCTLLYRMICPLNRCRYNHHSRINTLLMQPFYQFQCCSLSNTFTLLVPPTPAATVNTLYHPGTCLHARTTHPIPPSILPPHPVQYNSCCRFDPFRDF